MFRVVPMSEEYIEGFREVLDSVAWERRYLTFLEAPSLEESRRFVRRNIREGYVHEGRQRKAVRVDGKYENLICMALLLD